MNRLDRRGFLASMAVFVAGSPARTSQGENISIEDARKALERAVGFFADNAAKHGGYVYQYSADLKLSEGEETTGPDTVWVQPPGTPEVGMAMLEIYEKTGMDKAFEAAQKAAICLVNGQLYSGAWSDKIEFGAERKKMAYRVDGPLKAKAFNVSTFDDDKTQSAVRFLLKFDHATKGGNQEIHNALQFALKSIMAAQFPNGGFAQGFSEPADKSKPADLQASYPETWPRIWTGGKYWFYYTFNDGNIDNLIDMFFLAYRITGEEKYKTAAIKAGDFILNAQMPEQQPAWAQQYDFEMKPVWARKFEPPAISGGESQRILDTLIDLYLETGDKKFLEPIPKAMAWLESVKLNDGRLARFYELKTNKPLYFTKKYELTYDDTDVPTHYAFKVGNKLDRIRARYEKVLKLDDARRLKELENKHRPRNRKSPAEIQVAEIISKLDDRGAWLEPGRLKKQDPGMIIRSETFCKNARLLADYIHGNQ